jgi:cephalosporin hydroxylase
MHSSDPVKEFQQRNQEFIEKSSQDKELQQLAQQWFLRANSYEYSYHFTACGRPIIQYPQDMVAFAELVWQVKPDLIIETGIAHGGSLILSASQLALLDYVDAVNNGTVLDPKAKGRKVIGIDIDIRAHNRAAIEAHPLAHKIEMFQGSSIDSQLIDAVKKAAEGYNKILVCLDSNHTHEHVLAELEAYAPLVSSGSYCIVYDTVIEDMPAEMFNNRPWKPGNSPKTAVWSYLQQHPEFEIDLSIDKKLQITVAPHGFLRRR